MPRGRSSSSLAAVGQATRSCEASIAQLGVSNLDVLDIDLYAQMLVRRRRDYHLSKHLLCIHSLCVLSTLLTPRPAAHTLATVLARSAR